MAEDKFIKLGRIAIFPNDEGEIITGTLEFLGDQQEKIIFKAFKNTSPATGNIWYGGNILKVEKESV